MEEKITREQYRDEFSTLTRDMKALIHAMMKREGRDFAYCEVGNHAITNGKFDLHHTKYEGATYYDLQISCRKCNLQAENKLLE